MPSWKKVIISGSDAALNSLSLTSELYDNIGSAGTPGQMIQSTGTGFTWEDNIAESAQDLIVAGKNMEGTTIAKGTPLYFSGSNTAGNVVGVYTADAGDPDKMPAGGVAAEQLTSGQEGGVYLYGFINGVNTSAFNSGDTVFVAVGGGYTNIKPTGSALIQKLGNVERVDASNGSGAIAGPSWYNDLPNWEEGKIKVGRSDGQPVTSSFVHLDETNGRLGIDTTSPAYKLDVSGNGSFTDTLYIQKGASDVIQGGSSVYLVGGSGASYTQLQQGVGRFTIWGFDGAGWGEKMTINNTSGNVGIGTTSPSEKLHVIGTTRSTTFLSPNATSSTGLQITSATASGNGAVIRLTKDAADRQVYQSFEADQLYLGIPASNTTIGEVGTKSGVDLRFATGYTERMRITSTGNVGIGTASPNAKLHVATASSSGTTSMLLLSRASGYGHTLFEQTYDSTYFTNGKTLTLKNDSGTAFIHFAGNNVGTQTNVLIPTGNVGIGDSTPNEKLVVNGNIRAEGSGGTGNVDVDPLGGAFRLNGPGGFRGGLYNDQNLTGNVANSLDDLTTYVSDGSYHIALGGGTAQYNNKILTVSGSSVGIGTTTPSEKLHVSGSARITGAIYDSTNSAGTSGQVLSTTATGTQWIAAPGAGSVTGTGTTNFLSKFTGTSTLGNSLVFDNGTNVGIGTTSPSEKLHVAGKIRIGTQATAATDAVRADRILTAGDGLTGGGNLTANRTFAVDSSVVRTSGNQTIAGIKTFSSTIVGSINGNAGTATTWQTARTITIGNTGKSVNGSANVFWSLAEIGAQAALTNPITGTGANGRVAFWTGTTTQSSDTGLFWNNSTKRLGIGTTSPDSLLHLQGASPQLKIKNTTTGLVDITQIDLTGTVTGSGIGNERSILFGVEAVPARQVKIAYGQGSSNGQLPFLSISTGDNVSTLSERMRITSNGNVGIGNTTPASKLEVTGNVAIGYTNAAPANGMIVVGNVGIGTNSPSERLEVAGNIKTTGDVTVDNSSGDPFLRLKTTAQDYIVRIDQSDSEKFQIRDITNAATRLTIDTSGNVGIGTTTPTQKLHVSGSVRIEGALYDSNNTPGTSGQILSSTVTGTDWVSLSEISGVDGTGTANFIAKWSDADTITNSTIFDNGTNVGIGTTSPTSLLTLRSAGNSTVRFEDSGTTSVSQITRQAGTGLEFIVSTSARDFFFKENANNLMVIEGTGNVGIGTTSPQRKLSIEGSGLTSSIILKNTGTSGQEYTLFSSDNTNAGLGTGNFVIYDDTNSVSRLVINPSGNVGIGTTSPSGKLEVNTGSSAAYFTRTAGDDGLLSPVVAIAADSSKGLIGASGDSLTFKVRSVGTSNPLGGTTVMTLLPTGNVGIGTTSPGEKLDVIGNISTSNDIYIGNDIISTGEMYIKTGTNLRLQGNIITFSNAAGSTEYSRFDSSGRLGIGTTAPENKLHVQQADVFTGIHTTAGIRIKSSGASAIDSYHGTIALSRGTGGVAISAVQEASDSDVMGIAFFTHPSTTGGDAAVEKMRLDQDGNLGIGTTNPQSPLQVGNYAFSGGYSRGTVATFAGAWSSTLPTLTLISTDTTSTQNKGGSIAFAGGSEAGSTPYTFAQIKGLKELTGGTYSGYMAFYTTPAGSDSNTERMRITSSGNVGIGTTSPRAKLEVVGGVMLQNGENLEWGDTYANGAPTIFASTDFIKLAPTGVTSITTRQVHINPTGVGIGTASPGAKLDVRGDINVTNANISNYDLTVPPGTTVVASVSAAIYSSVAIDYVVKNGLNLRSGTIVACHDGTSTVFTETSTPDIGSTTDITFNVSVLGADLVLQSTVTLPGWEVKTLVRAL